MLQPFSEILISHKEVTIFLADAFQFLMTFFNNFANKQLLAAFTTLTIIQNGNPNGHRVFSKYRTNFSNQF